MAKSVYANNKLHKEQVNDAWTKLFELIPFGSKVLDVGCSSGNFGAELRAKKQCEVIGVDIFEDDLKIAAKHLDKVFLRNVERDNFDDLGQFDVMLMADVIEHLIDPVPALEKLKKRLKKSGILVFSVPNMANIGVRLELLKGRFEYTKYGILDQTHLHYYDRIQLSQVLRDAGFTIVKTDNTVRDVPRDIAKKYLAEVGLVPSEKFWKRAEDIDAISFQFIGVAIAEPGEHAPMETKAPHDFVSESIDQIHEQYGDEIQRLTRNVEDITTVSAKQKSDLKRVEKELSDIYSSRAWKALDAAHGVVHKIRKLHSKK